MKKTEKAQTAIATLTEIISEIVMSKGLTSSRRKCLNGLVKIKQNIGLALNDE